MQKDKIGFAGEGWGAVSAVKGLQKSYNLQCLTVDQNVIENLSGNFDLISKFDEFDCDIIICAGYRPIIGLEILRKHRIINIHYSLLPSYRGLHSTAWAIMNGEEKLGLSIFKMNQYIDDGPILHQKEFINDQISSATYYMNLMNLYIEKNLAKIINGYEQETLIITEQNKTKASWVGKRTQKHNIIDFSKGFEYCKRLFRVLQPPYPNPQIKYKGEIFTVGKFSIHESAIDTDISRILNVDDEGVWVKSIDGYIILNDILDKMGRKVDNNIFKIGLKLND